MSRDRLLMIEPDAPLLAAKKIISSNDVGRLPVMDQKTLVGIVSRSDIINGAKA